jgi:multiple sugar transport system substrate-binding protein
VSAKTPYKVVQLPRRTGNHETGSATDLWVGLDHKDPLRAYWTQQFLGYLTSAEADAELNLGGATCAAHL